MNPNSQFPPRREKMKEMGGKLCLGINPEQEVPKKETPKVLGSVKNKMMNHCAPERSGVTNTPFTV